MLKRPAKDNHSSLLQKFVNYGRKKFYNIGPSLHVRQKESDFQSSEISKFNLAGNTFRQRESVALTTLIRKPFQPSLISTIKAWTYPRGEPERFSTLRQATGLTHKHKTRLDRLARGKHCIDIRWGNFKIRPKFLDNIKCDYKTCTCTRMF